jgi:hypothetical protein
MSVARSWWTGSGCDAPGRGFTGTSPRRSTGGPIDEQQIADCGMKVTMIER